MGIKLPLSQMGTPPIFGPYLLRPSGCMDQDNTFLELGIGPGDYVRWGRRSLLPEGGGFSAHAYCSQRGRCIKMPHGMDVSLSPGEFVLDGDPVLPPRQRGLPSPIFGTFLLCPNGWMHQDATRFGGRPQPRPVCVRWGPSPSPKGGGAPSPILRVEVENFEIVPEVWGTSGCS